MANLTIQQRRKGETTILDLQGKLRLGGDGASLRESVRSLVAAGEKQILINLEGVGYMDSSGLGDLVSAIATAKRDGAAVKLVTVSRRVDSLLQMTRLITVFETFDDEETAVSSFEPAPPALAPL